LRDVRDAADKWLDNDRKGAPLGGIGQFAQIGIGDSTICEDGIVKAPRFLYRRRLDWRQSWPIFCSV